MNTSSVRNLRSLLAILAGASLAAIGFAQQAAAASPTDDKTVKLDKFIVTGSNIPTTETASEARTFPVQTIDRKLIEESGLFNTTELLQKLTLSNGGSVPFTNNATGFTTGATSLSLRGLGPEATLVLINGRRMAPYPIGQGGTTAFVDLNTIPLNAIERIEILKDGASATYGADAVAGVVNIILRRDYNGAVATVSYGNTTNKDSAEATANILYGVTSDKGSITIGANFQHRNPIFNRDRSYSAGAENTSFKSTNSSPPNFQVSRDAVLAALGLPPGSPLTFLQSDNTFAVNTATQVFFATTGPTTGGNSTDPGPGNRNTINNGLLPASAYTFSTARRSRFNFKEFSGTFPEITRRGTFASWERQFFNPNMKTYGDAFFQQVDTSDELAPYATGNFASPGQISIVIPARTPNPILTPAEIAAGGVRTAAAGAFNPFNPFNQDISGSSRIRLAEFGNRVYENRNTAFAVTGGLKIDNINDKWSLDTKLRWSAINNNTNARLISTGRLLRVLNQADPIFAAGGALAGKAAYNPFGFFRNPIPANNAAVAFATHFLRDQNSSTLFDAGTSLSTGELMDLPAGGVGFALGVDFRREAISQNPDSALQAGEILASTPSSPVNRQRKVASYFTEFEIPIFSDKHSATGARSLSLNLAARYEDFVTSKRHAAVPKIGLRWLPIDDTLVVRASWGRGFREPSLYELFAPPVNALAPIFDPVSGVRESEQPVSVAGNRLLAAENAKSWNFGTVWSPKGRLAGFTIAVDAWRIERNGTVSVDFQNTLSRSLVGGGGLIPGESVLRDFAGNLLQVNSVFRNLGKTKVQGLDLATSYVLTTDDWGRFNFGVNATYTNSYKVASNPGEALQELVGQAIPGSTAEDAYLRWKGQAYVGWNWKGLGSRVTANYTDSFGDLDENSAPRKVASTMIYDLQVSYTLFPAKGREATAWWSDLKLTAGVTNLFDKDPPLAVDEGNNPTGYPSTIYTAQGRFLYIGLEKKL